MSLITAPILQCPVNAAPGSIANLLVTKSPVSFAVPLSESNRHYAEILKQVADGDITIEEAD